MNTKDIPNDQLLLNVLKSYCTGKSYDQVIETIYQWVKDDVIGPKQMADLTVTIWKERMY